MADLTPEILAQVSAGYWAKLNKVRLANGQPFDFEGREYQIEPMECRASETVDMKATGGGFSEIRIFQSLHGMLKGRYPQGVGYYFPTDEDMQDYVKSRFNPLIQYNYEAIGQYLKTAGVKGGSDAASFKRIGTSNLYLRGARLQPMGDSDGSVRQSTKTSGIQIDRAVLDEVDQMELEVIAKIRGRMANACVDGQKGSYELAFIGNPSDEDLGVDLLYQQSDQREWFRKCTCGALTCAELEFINDPEKCVGFYSNGRGYIRCVKCGKPVGQRVGQWIPQHPENKHRAGFHWSHLSSEYQDPARILRDYRNPPENNFGDIMRLDLGLAYSSVDEKLRKDMVYACCSTEGVPDKHTGPCAMGVDNDDRKHVVILVRTGNERYKVIKTLVCENFQEVLDLIQRFNIRSCVGDLRPNADSAREFQRAALSKRCKTYLCEYTDSPLQEAVFNDNNGVVKVYRTGVFDFSHRMIVNQYIILPRRQIMTEFAIQCCNCVKAKEKNKKTGMTVFRYKKTGGGQDHYRNALNYALTAANKVGKVKLYDTDSGSKKELFVTNDTARYI